MVGWKERTLGEVTSFITKGIPPKYSDYESESTLWVLNQKCNRNFEISYLDARLHDYKLKKVPENKLLVNGDVLINSTGIGTAGRVAQIQNIQKPTTIDGHMILLRPTDEIDVMYYGYAIKACQGQIEGIAEGSTGQTEINRKRLQDEVIVRYPVDKRKQKAIAYFLFDIDKKIKINTEINNNLEQQAKAIYQEFFSPKSSIKGNTVTLDEYCHIFTGKKNVNASIKDGKYKFFTCAPDALQIDSYIYDGNAIIVSGNGAYTGRTRFFSGRFNLYQRTYACTLSESVEPDYIFPLYWFVKLELSKKIMGGTRGSAIPYIVINDLAKFEFIYNEEIFMAYMPIFKSITESIQANEFENDRLVEIRDILLPQLISANIDISNINI
jgi:type I restriction modification DNA specificity domain protein (fragment)